MNQNYQKQLDEIINNITTNKSVTDVPKLLIHSCCAPCSSYCLEYLMQYFDITLLYYNPNITDETEYVKRVNEQQRLINAYNVDKRILQMPEIKFLEGNYNPKLFFDLVKGYEKCEEGGERCKLCFEMRLGYTAEIAAREKYDFFTTTLTISPLKNAALLNEIGQSLATQYGIKFLPSDFKKRNGYKRSIELSKEYDLYRQDYCGCIYSKVQRENSKTLEINN